VTPVIETKSKLGSKKLMWILIGIVAFLVLLLLPLILCWTVPCCCPDSSLALWIFTQKEKFKGKEKMINVKKKETSAKNIVPELLNVVGTDGGVFSSDEIGERRYRANNRVMPQTDIEYERE
jgi:flagellar basal body-associated protein FliL